MQIVKYLTSISNKLKEDEMKTLKSEPIWPKENSNKKSTNIQRFIISNLHVPSNIHREFDFALIDWNKWWSRNSPEGNI